MSEDQLPSAGVKAHYAAQVAADLEHNAAEQERLAAEVASIEEKLRVLRFDRDLLLNVQRALGDGEAATPVESEVAQVPEPRSAPAASAPSAPSRRKKAAATRPDTSRIPGPRTKSPGKATRPTLVALVTEYLGQSSKPHSASEITAALGQSHPERDVKATVVRNAVEALVAKGLAERSRQGSSVFYTTANKESVENPEPVSG
ncbi:hypothetical protein [Streptomyces sp. NBC_01198]|uniref:hypothetical protein n=1 Tax=Streptomyces sp. NBC_01198 TaxID=2903769 RepID=UPI002E12B6E2|nr:hypothetical protein OG702_04620 [Streptomyces sp. NBC_01198]